MINLIVAFDDKQGMADETGIPWQGKLTTDIQRFRNFIKHGVVLMGYRTYTEYPAPPSDKANYVVTRPGTEALRPGFEAVEDVAKLLSEATEDVWVIGGAQLFADTIKFADNLYITRVSGDFNCTKFFPDYQASFKLASEQPAATENGIAYQFQIWQPVSA